jgi:hypothetical protein
VFYIQAPVKGRNQGLHAGRLVFSLVEPRFLSENGVLQDGSPPLHPKCDGQKLSRRRWYGLNLIPGGGIDLPNPALRV